MKENELRKHATCTICKKKIGHTGIPMFWRVSVERFGLDANALQRQQGLTMMLGNSAAIAHAMGPNEDLAKPIMEKLTITVCESCALDNQHCVAEFAEFAVADDNQNDPA